ncbi:unnamed protein product [Aureobasidium pullulans]|nr:unnamed protein product [Aureobasidium pullulans]
MPPKLPILISSAVASILLAHFAPGYGSRTQTFFLVAFTEFIAWATWRVTLAEVLSSKNYEFIKPAHFLDIIGRILGIGLLFAEGDEHRTQRKNLMPAFSYRHIKDLYPVFWSKSKEMVERMSDAMHEGSETGNTSKESIPEGTKSSNVVEVSDWTSRATLDIIGVAGMGRDFEALKNPDNELNQTYKTIFHPPKSARYLQVAGMFLPRWFLKSLPIKRNDEISEGSALIKQTCRDLIAAKKIRMEKGAADETDILSVALRSGSFADENLVSQMMTFLTLVDRRHLQQNGGAESNYSFLTFLHGPRSCIGQGFANAEFACLLAAWIGKFDTEFEDPEYVLEVKSGITSRPKNGLRVKLTEVEGW